jgi:hypothetical protein
VVHAREAFHEVAEFFPFIVVAFEKVGAVLDWNNDGATVTDFGLGRQGKECSCSEGNYGGDWGLGR